MKLTPQLSAYLDFLRFAAALSVMIGHMDRDGLGTGWLYIGNFSHEAVVTFFVLSGFIIYSTSKNRGGLKFAVARISRVYSVAFPAVIFSFAVAAIFPNLADYFAYKPLTAWNITSSLLFLNASWNNAADVSLNNPYWSLCYEVWYYAIFGVAFFVRSHWRWAAVCVLALIAGPAVLILFPVWLLGVGLARSDVPCPRRAAWILFLLAPITILAVNISGTDIAIRIYFFEHVPGWWQLGSSQRFLTDYLLGLAIVMHIRAFPLLGEGFQNFFARNAATIKYLASFSFTLYLFHRPLTHVGGALFPEPGKVGSLIGVAIILLTCLAVSYGTERRLGNWRQGVGALLATSFARRGQD